LFWFCALPFKAPKVKRVAMAKTVESFLFIFFCFCCLFSGCFLVQITIQDYARIFR
jgi:hypothetical protein